MTVVDHATAGFREAEVARCPLVALRSDGARWVGDGVVVVRAAGGLVAFPARCPHNGASLDDAAVERGAVVCPLHGARFRLRDGRPLSGPTREALTCLVATAQHGEVVVRHRQPAPRPAFAWLRRLLRR